MKPLLVIKLIVFASCSSAFADQKDINFYQYAQGEWEQLAFGDGSKEESIKAFDKMQEAWKRDTQFSRDHSAYYHALAAITTARIADNDDAIRLLGVAANIAREYPVVISRGKSPKRFEEVASVHARVWATSGSDPFAGVTIGYEMFQENGHCFAIQNESVDERVLEVSLESLTEEHENLGLLLDLDAKGFVIQVLPVALVEGKGSFQSRLRAIFESQRSSPEAPNHFVRKDATEFLSGVASSRKAGETVDKKIPHQDPSTQSISKSLLLMVIVIVIGIVGLFVKKWRSL